MATSLGTAWIQIKPSLAGISKDIEKELGDTGTASGKNLNKNFSGSFLASAKATFSSAFSELGQRSEQAFSQFKTTAIVGFTAAFAAGTLLMKNFINSASELQTLRASFESLTGSAAGAEKVMSTMYDFGKKTAFSNEQINQTARLFLGAGLEAKNLKTIMSQVGDLAGATGADLQGIALPISQAMAAGKLQTQDWYQILNQGGGVFKKYIIEALGAGHTTKTFADDMSKGAITADVLGKALQLATKEGSAAFQGAIKQSETFNGRMSNLQESITNVGLAILGVDAETGNVDPSGIFAQLSGAVKDATGWLEENKEQILQWVTQVVNTGKEIIKWVSDNRELVLTILKIVVAFKALQIATGGVISVMKTLSPYANLVKGTIQGITGLITKISGLGGASKAAEVAAGNMDKMSQAAKKAPKSFTFGDSVASFFKNIGQVLSGAVNTILAPIQTLAKGSTEILQTVLGGIGKAIASFFSALAAPQVLVGAVFFAAAAASVALAILTIGGAIGIVAPGLGSFLNLVLIPLGAFLLGVFIASLVAVTNAIVNLTNGAVVPLIGAMSGGLTMAMNSVAGVFNSAGGAISRVVTAIADGISKVIRETANLISGVGRQDWYGTGYGITRNFSAGLIDGLIDLLQDSLNKIINQVVNIPGIGDALKAVGVKANPVNLSGFKLGRRAAGGPVFGAGGPTSDSIPMLLSDGEYVIKTATAKKIGYSNLDQLNSTGELGGSSVTVGDIVIQGYNKDPRELANEISGIIARQRARVMG